MDANENVAEDSSDRFGIFSCSRMPNKKVDEQAVLFKKLRRLKNERSCYLSTVSAKRN